MAYFRCTTGGSGKGNTLVVTCADDLAGATITCTNGTKTYTKTCPSTAPYEVTFYGLEAGTWTVSATVSGNTYTTTVVITDYEAELGGFNWKAWVDLSQNYTSSDFTDLDDLLSDETAIRELMTIHACVDYLAEIAAASADVEQIIENDYCAKWINLRDYALDTLYANEIIADYMDEADKYFYGEWVITDNTTTPPTWGAKGNVPIMTANNAPYGEANASSYAEASQYPAWKAFDGISSVGGTDMWNSANGRHTNQWIYFKFPHPVCIKKVVYASAFQVGYTPKNIIIQGSNDGTTYKDLKNFLGENTTADQTIDVSSNDEYFLYGRFYITDSYSTGTMTVVISKLQFYGRELSVSVPKMDTNTTPYGEASGSSAATNAPIYNAFDENTNTAWSSTTTLGWIQYQFINKIVPKMVGIGTLSSGSGRQALKGTVQAIVNGTSIDLKEFSVTEAAGQIAYIDIENDQDVEYDTLRLNITQSNVVNGNVTVNTFQIYGLDYSEREFEEGVTKKWLYDHGVELETLTNQGGETVTRRSNDILMVGTVSGTIGCDVATGNIDLTNYNVLFARCSGEYIYNQYEALAVSPAFGSAVTAIKRPLALPLSSLDISAINQTQIVYVGTASPGGKLSISEFWLE